MYLALAAVCCGVQISDPAKMLTAECKARCPFSPSGLKASARPHTAPLEIDARDQVGSFARPSNDLLVLRYTAHRGAYPSAWSVTADSDHSRQPAELLPDRSPRAKASVDHAGFERIPPKRLDRRVVRRLDAAGRLGHGLHAASVCFSCPRHSPMIGPSLTSTCQPSHHARRRPLLVLEAVCVVCQDRSGLQSRGVREQGRVRRGTM